MLEPAKVIGLKCLEATQPGGRSQTQSNPVKVKNVYPLQMTQPKRSAWEPSKPAGIRVNPS
jgi:hypothetical protein